MSYKWLTIVGLVLVIVLAGCATTGAPDESMAEEATAVADAPAESVAAEAEEPAFDMTPHEKEGFVLLEEDGRLWVFRDGSADLEKFRAEGEPAKQVIRPAAGVNGVTLKSTEAETIDEYLTTLPGWVTIMEDGRLWVFRAGSEDLEKFLAEGEPAKQVVRPLAGPYGLTMKGIDGEELDAYMVAWDAR
jgi:hypothetical protein